MLRVREEGLQRLRGAALARSIPGSITIEPAQLHLQHQGQEISLQLIGSEDGRRDAGDELRFFAPAPGDRWNATDTYWLTLENTPGQRSATSEARPGSAPLRTTAQEVDARPVTGGVADAREARARTLASLNQGAGLVNYVGHSHTWQWALTDPAVTPSYLLGLYDVDALRNGEKLPIVLEMPCLTSAFQQSAYSGTTIDERLVLHPSGGAIATWGPTGLGIAHGHDALQRRVSRAVSTRYLLPGHVADVCSVGRSVDTGAGASAGAGVGAKHGAGGRYEPPARIRSCRGSYPGSLSFITSLLPLNNFFTYAWYADT